MYICYPGDSPLIQGGTDIQLCLDDAYMHVVVQVDLYIDIKTCLMTGWCRVWEFSAGVTVAGDQEGRALNLNVTRPFIMLLTYLFVEDCGTTAIHFLNCHSKWVSARFFFFFFCSLWDSYDVLWERSICQHC